ncbi:hypothetical protein BON22_1980, partial [Cyberlindnera fabianii]
SKAPKTLSFQLKRRQQTFIVTDMSDIYGVGFKDVSAEQDKVTDTKSFAIIAFRLEDEKFDVVEPTTIDDE